VTRAFAAVCLLCLALDAAAIVRRHDREDARYREAAKGIDAVVDMNLPGGGGTLIAPRWVLTAAHVTALMKLPHEVMVKGEKIAVRRIVAYPGGQVGRDDIALVELAHAVKGVKPVPLYEARDEEGKEIVIAGRGFAGDGEKGAVEKERGVLRAGTNRIDKALKNWLVFTFDAPPAGTELESVSGPGDSGGPAFIAGLLAGVSSAQDDRATGREGAYGVSEYYARVSSYRAWIEATMK